MARKTTADRGGLSILLIVLTFRFQRIERTFGFSGLLMIIFAVSAMDETTAPVT
jgi:hypothetical protein